MEFEIELETLNKTTKCPVEFLCLEDENYPQCQCEQVINQVAAVQRRTHALCPYGVRFGQGFFCTCPTRVAIYRKYKD